MTNPVPGSTASSATNALGEVSRRHVAPALRSRNFRLFWIGQLLSTAGTSLQVVAEGWLIYQITGSTFWLGMVGFLALLPVVPISFLGGVVIDRVPRRRLIMSTQAGLLIQAAIFGLIALTGRIQLWHIIVLYFLFGSLLAIDHPARRAFLVDIVSRKDLANAVALNATLFNISNLVGFAAAGVLIAAIGAGGTILVNAATYLAPIAALAAIRVPDVGHAERSQRQPLRSAVLEGIKTLWKQPTLLGIISLMAVVGGLAWPVYGLMPAFAEDVLGTDSIGLGLLLAAGALGSVLGTILTARIGQRRQGRMLILVSLLLPVLVAGFARAHTLLVAGVLMVAVGFLLLILQSLTITLVQVNVADRVRGRVMTIYSQLHAGADTMGNVLVGSLATYAGLPLALALGGAAALIYAVGVRVVMPQIQELDSSEGDYM